jgi:hypothetical protein
MKNVLVSAAAGVAGLTALATTSFAADQSDIQQAMQLRPMQSQGGYVVKVMRAPESIATVQTRNDLKITVLQNDKTAYVEKVEKGGQCVVNELSARMPDFVIVSSQICGMSEVIELTLPRAPFERGAMGRARIINEKMGWVAEALFSGPLQETFAGVGISNTGPEVYGHAVRQMVADLASAPVLGNLGQFPVPVPGLK